MKRTIAVSVASIVMLTIAIWLTVLTDKDLPEVGDHVRGIHVPSDAVWAIAVDPESVGLELSRMIHVPVKRDIRFWSAHEDGRLLGGYEVIGSDGKTARIMRPIVSFYEDDDSCLVVDFGRVTDFEVFRRGGTELSAQ